MLSKLNQRKEERLKFKNVITFEESLGEERYGITSSAKTFDLGARGIGFYTNKEFKLNTLLRVNFQISNSEKISFIASVVRLQLYKSIPLQYLVGTEIKNISAENGEKLKLFLQEINIFTILDKISLNDVMDIHFIPGYPIILKKLGKLVTVGKPLDEYTVENLLLSTMDEKTYAKFNKIKDINFIMCHKDKRFRFNIHMQQGKVEAVCRVVNVKIPMPSQLGLPQVTESMIKNNSRGLIIIAGRTGAGKTTTLASLTSFLSNVINGVIISIEDPIEYIQEKGQCIIKQREVGRDTISYGSAVRNALRQNPDVLIIGEILDQETMDLVLTAAESGTLVLTTIHATSVTQVLDRVLSFFPLDFQKHTLTRLSLTLKGIIVQSLFPSLMGTNNMVLATEIFLVNDVGKKLIREADWKQIPDYFIRGRHQGMQTMQESIEFLVDKGIIDYAYLRDFLPLRTS